MKKSYLSLQIQKKKPSDSSKKVNAYEFLVYGVLIGVFGTICILVLYKYKNIFHFKKHTDEKTLLKKLLAFDNDEAKQYIKEIEEYLYGSKETPVDKKRIEKFIKSCEE